MRTIYEKAKKNCAKEQNIRTSYEREKKNCAHIPDTRKSGIEEAEEMRERAKNAYKSKKKQETLYSKSIALNADFAVKSRALLIKWLVWAFE
ncbi:hypothetical protein [Cytobacillus sp. FSL R7-0680]|uniref:hypothetical protein n=1 Tax=Cytobacillus sp. FSL R7-0680 TaxID=2921689 RepID=UPI0030F6AEA9